LTPFLIAAQDPETQDTPAKTDEPASTTPADESKPKDADTPRTDEAKPAADPNARVVKSLDEWRRELTRAQFMVTRMKATEPAFSGHYASGHFRGTFVCVCCGAELFSSAHKFESGTGWPSFYRPISLKALRAAPDYSEAQPRIEVTCARCGAHLGHVFSDGPPPTGRRFCINSLALKLLPPGASTTSTRKSTSKAKAKTSAKTPKSEPAQDADKTETNTP
jgi:peptide-methionine (R)-S-oxide reductase